MATNRSAAGLSFAFVELKKSVEAGYEDRRLLSIFELRNRRILILEVAGLQAISVPSFVAS